VPGEGGADTLTAISNLRLVLLVALVVLIGDVASKLAVHHAMQIGQPSIPVAGNWLRLTYVRNPGSAFSLFTGSRWFFIGVSVLSVLLILSLAIGRRQADRWTRISLGLILGGALGNLWDRIRFGTVIDFLDMGIGVHRWPVYNVADIGVTVGVVILVLRLILDGKVGAGEIREAGRE
jgi:signal peptidase II